MNNGYIRNMALVSHQSQGFYVISSSRRLSWSKRLQMKQCLTKCHMIGRTDYLSKQNICLSVGPPCFCVAKLKPLRISGFKGHAQNDDSETRANRLKVPQTSVRLEESGEVHNVPLSYASGANEGLETSSAIHRLFKKWLMILRAQPSNQDDDENLGEPPPSGETLQGNQSKARSGILKVAWSHFLALDATVKVPLLIFVPFYLAVNVKYGVEVSKDLTPLWVFGPLIVALYVMIIRGLWSLYAFTFFQTIKVIKNLPSYCILVFNYVFRGKLKEDVRAYLLQPILDIKNRDYKQLTRNKLKELQVWIMEKYLDFVESIWPYYCRTIRFLKKANLI